MAKQITIEQALNGKRDFYSKSFQNNEYYPIDKYVYHADTDEFEQFVQKTSGWKSWGIPKAAGISNKDWLKYIFEHNGKKLTWDEMTDNKNYNTN